jgi:hypothetical protein
MSYRFKPDGALTTRARSLGVLFGHSVRAIEFVAHKNSLSASQVFSKELGVFDTSKEGIAREAQLAFQELVAKSSVKEISLSVPEEIFYTTLLRLPTAPDRDIYALAEMHLENHFSHIKTHYVLACKVLVRDTHGSIVRVVVRRSSALKEYSSYLKMNSKKHLFVEGSLTSLARATLGREERQPTLLISLGSVATEFGICIGNDVVATATIPYGGMQIKTQCIEGTSLTAKEVGKLLETQGFSMRSPHKAFQQSLVLAVAPIVDAAKSLLVHFGAHTHEMKMRIASCDRAYLAGTDAYIHSLPEFLSRALHLSCSFAPVWKHAHLDNDEVPPIPLKEALGHGSAIGAGLRFLVD